MTIATARLLPLDQRGLAATIGLAAAGSLLLALAAKIQVPFWPVPMTLQSLAVLLIGVGYGGRLAGLTVLAYLAEGLAGLPVFASAVAGPAAFAGPTAGYLLGFLLAAVLVGTLARRGWAAGPWRVTALFTLGHAVLFVPGVLWLAALFGWERALAVGVAPFLVATLVKTGLGVALVVAWHAARRGPDAPGRHY